MCSSDLGRRDHGSTGQARRDGGPEVEAPAKGRRVTARYDVVTRTSVTMVCSRNDVAIKAMTKFLFMRRDGDSGNRNVASKPHAGQRRGSHVSMRVARVVIFGTPVAASFETRCSATLLRMRV